jgi:ubiquinone/menaquinone biosynthesis C-methylase UbiE
MAAQYDAIAEQYARTRASPLRRWVEQPSFLQLIGDVRGLRVLDLACGDGFYTRALQAAGAAEVIGVDISPAMIALARQAEGEQPVGIDYVCADAAALPDLGRFDCVVAAYLLHYASDIDALASMCAGIARSLSPGGRFVTLNENPAEPAEADGLYAQYGFTKTIDGAVVDGAVIRYRMLAGRGSFGFSARYYRRATYEAVLAAAGFHAVCWHALMLDPAGADAIGADYFTAYLARPPVIGLSCRR